MVWFTLINLVGTIVIMAQLKLLVCFNVEVTEEIFRRIVSIVAVNLIQALE